MNTTFKKPFTIAITVLAGIMFIGYLVGKDKKSSPAQGLKETKSISYNDYIATSENLIKNLGSDSKSARDRSLLELKSNTIYKILVDSLIVTSEYLPLLTGACQGICSMGKNGFTINEDLEKEIENSPNGEAKLRFTTLIPALANKLNGGVPLEIIEVFERYKTKYNFFGEKGVFVNANTNTRETIRSNYDMSSFFAMVYPKDQIVLNSFYEGKQMGFSGWSNAKGADYPFLSSKEAYMNYIKEIYPESPYILNADLEITALELHKEYAANEVAADQKFKGKKLSVTGVIGNISKDVLDDPYITLQVTYLETVNCYFADKNNHILAQLRKGQKITIIGLCRGLVLGGVILKDCEME